MMSALRAGQARDFGAGWLRAVSGGFLPRIVLGRTMRLGLLVVIFVRCCLMWVGWDSCMDWGISGGLP
jgi:hypothetical protein